jgi:hypothetical protein
MTIQGGVGQPSTAVEIATQVSQGRDVAKSLDWLTKNADQLARWETVEDWVLDTGGESGPIPVHFMKVRAEMARQLWTRGLYVGVTVIDELLWAAVSAGEAYPVLAVLHRLVDSHALDPTYVLYPLHSFGLRGQGYFFDRSVITVEEIAREYGIAVGPQTFEIDGVAAWLEHVHDWFGVTAGVPVDRLAHWQRRAPWLCRNPLLAVKLTAISGTYYENQRLILDRLHIATTFLAGLAVRQPATDPREDSFNTSTVNNWFTLDIRHYFVMSAVTDEDGCLTGDSVPMISNSEYLAEISDLPVILDANYWNTHINEPSDLWHALNTLADLQMRSRFQQRNRRLNATARTVRKAFTSLDYFRRSLGTERWYAITSLGTAFEMLLTSHYEPGVGKRLGRRASLLTGDPADGKLIERLYEVRSKMVHASEPPSEAFLLPDAQRVYLACLQKVADAIPTIGNVDDNPLRTITKDFEQPDTFLSLVQHVASRTANRLRGVFGR